MKHFLLFGLILFFSNVFAQGHLFTNEDCFEKISNVETSRCLSEKTLQAKKYLEKEFDVIHKKVIKKLNSSNDMGQGEIDAFTIYASNLPKLKTALIENAFLYAEIMSASSSGGSGYESIKSDIYLDELKKVYDYLQQIKKEVINEE